ncbi:MAG: DUF262 domain-containing protein [Acidobacteriota bacterium]|nr:DUF262 domain-containing protein [Acidobacteriota bacterium]
MKMTEDKRAIDKIYRRRDRYDIPDWQREEVWDRAKKQGLIDSILRGWRLPKFYFIKTSDNEYLIEDGQQRLAAIFDFFSNELPVSQETQKLFGGPLYRDLPQSVADKFDDFEIDFDGIENASDEELKEFFQRLQQGMGLNTSEKLNAVHSKLRDYCRQVATQPFFKNTVSISNTRYAHFDIVAKVATIEIEGVDTGLRLDDVKRVFQEQTSFSGTSAIGKRIRTAIELLDKAFQGNGHLLRTRTIVQSLITLTCRLVATGKVSGREQEIYEFVSSFMKRLGEQIELGQAATDSDYVTFQRSVSANVKGGTKTRQEILIRKLFQIAPELSNIFDPSVIKETGISGRLTTLGKSIPSLVDQLNKRHAAKTGEDLFKATNKTTQALIRIAKPISSVEGYESLIDDLYFLFREGTGSRLADSPPAFKDVNDLRTDLRHDTDHGDPGKSRAKRRKAGTTFSTYAGDGTPETIDPGKLCLVQANLLTAIEGDLRGLLVREPPFTS